LAQSLPTYIVQQILFEKLKRSGRLAMDKNSFKDSVKRLEEISEVIKDLPTEIRADAFQILKSYVTGVDESALSSEGSSDDQNIPESKIEFFEKHKSQKPADNLKLIVAWHYSQYGNSPISIDEIRGEAASIGLTIPDRPNDTLKNSQHKSKSLFTSAGHGKYKPTVHGESFFKKTFSVKKGTKRRSVGDS
jgi:hypothetical protein